MDSPKLARRGCHTVRTSWSVVVLLAMHVGHRCVAADAPQPNILWITVEDTSPDLGCYGDGWARTPNLDRLASEGVRFTRAFSVSGVCAPSRSALITGMYPTKIGTQHMDDDVVPPGYVRCFTEYLRAAGYYCTNRQKTHYNFRCPVTAWDENGRDAHWRGRRPGQPFFAVFNFETSHEGTIRDRVPGMLAKATRRLRAEDRHDPAEAVLPPYYPDTPVVRRDWANYYDIVTAADLDVGDVLAELEADGLADETIVFFFSDHGRGLPRAKRWIYDSGMHVPCVVRWSGRIKPGSVRLDPISFVDFAPTVLSLAGVPIPAEMDGQVFLGPQRAPPRRYVFAARDRMDETYDIIRAVRDRRFNYIRNYEPGKPYAQYIHYADQMPTLREMRRLNAEGKLVGPQRNFFLPTKPEEELYDTRTDPHEVNNLAGSAEHRDVLERMRRELTRWIQRTGDQGFTPEAVLDERMRPRGKVAVTAAPTIMPNGGAHRGPLAVSISCPTRHASIAYTLESGKAPHWMLYTRPIKLTADARLRAKACRLGFEDSPIVAAGFRVTFAAE